MLARFNMQEQLPRIPDDVRARTVLARRRRATSPDLRESLSVPHLRSGDVERDGQTRAQRVTFSVLDAAAVKVHLLRGTG